MRATDAPRTVAVHETLAAAAAAAAREVVATAREAVERRGRFVIALAGGETPRPLYGLLASEYRDALRWDRVDICFGDERCVPPDDAASNYALVESTLLEQVPVAADRVYRIAGEVGPDRAARDYDARLRQILRDDADGPTFDVALLGVGPDGHTASLFPGDSALAETERWAVPALAPPGTKVRERVTVTLPVLNRARVVLFLCAGPEKRDVVAGILSGGAPQLPAARVHGVERTLWILDRAIGG